MRAVLVVLCLAACGPEPTTAPDGGALPEPDASTDEPLALEPGAYTLEWICIDGCGGLLFPPSTFNRLDVSNELELTFRTEATTNAQTVLAAEADSECVLAAALIYSEGETGAVQFCPAPGGPVATIVYTAEYGPMPERTWFVQAAP